DAASLLRPAAVVTPIERVEPVSASAAAVAPSEPVLAPAPAIEAHEQAPTSDPKPEVRVTVDLANLRAGPGMQHAVVGQTRRGDTLELLERRNQWLHVRLGKLDAWLHVTLTDDNGAEPRAGAGGMAQEPKTQATIQRRVRLLWAELAGDPHELDNKVPLAP